MFPMMVAVTAASQPAAAPAAVLRPLTVGAAASTGDPRQAHDIVTLEARQLQGAEAIQISGHALPSAPITVTLLAIVSPDVPTILVSRNEAIADVNGRFGAVIPIASAYERGTLLRLVATSPSGAQATAQLVVDAPNAGVTVPLESQR